MHWLTLKSYIFLGIWTFFPYFQIYWHKFIIIPSFCLLSVAPMLMFLFAFFIEIIYASSPFFMIKLTRSLSILLIFSLQNSQLLVWLIPPLLYLFPRSLISALIFIIFCHIVLGLILLYLSNFWRHVVHINTQPC